MHHYKLRWILVPLLLSACNAETPLLPAPAPPDVIPYARDWSSSRLVTAEFGDRRLTHMQVPQSGLPAANLVPVPHQDWSYRTHWTAGGTTHFDGAAINGGPALIGADFTMGTCTDLLLVPIDTTGASGGPTLMAFTNLYNSCTNTTDANCTANSAGHCPTLSWSLTLDGGLQGSSPALDLNAQYAFVATTTGKVYKIDLATHALSTPFDARADIGAAGADATFTYTSPWVEYSTSKIYIAASYSSDTRSRLYELDIAGTTPVKTASIDLTQGNSSAPITFNGFLYSATLDARIHKIDQSTFTEVTTGGWPVTSGNNRTLLSSPSIDGTNNLLFATYDDTLLMVRLGNGNRQTSSISGVGGTNPGVSSPALDPNGLSVFVGHERRLWRKGYTAAGSFSGSNNRSLATSGNALNPSSSPLVFTPVGTKFAYIGDFAGNMNEITVAAGGGLSITTQFANSDTGSKAPTNVRMESPIILDYQNGNLYFGDDSAIVYQVTQSGLQ